jgi:large subunit ribosomal protein L22
MAQEVIVKKTEKAAKVIKAPKAEVKVAKREFKVLVRNVAQSPLKLRLVVNMVRRKGADVAIRELSFLNKKGSLFVLKAVKSAVANAKSLADLTADKLVIKSISVNEATGLKRGRVASRSRVASLLKRRSHINLVLAEK